MCIVHRMWLTLAKLISLYLFSVNMRGKLCNIDLITLVFIHTPHIAPVSLLITPDLSTILSTRYPQGFRDYQQVQACPVCITCFYGLYRCWCLCCWCGSRRLPPLNVHRMVIHEYCWLYLFVFHSITGLSTVFHRVLINTMPVMCW